MEKARAAVEALREPTPEIIEAAVGNAKAGMPLVAEGIWIAMIDRILKEELG